jgi:esterase/lipase
MRKLKIGFFISINIVAIYLLGPHPEKPYFDNALPYISYQNSIDDYVSKMESNFKIKENNEAKIIWADSTKQVTEFAIVYLHGFSASQMEGDPVHRNIAKKFHCNLYLARLAEHGLTGSDAMKNLTAENLWQSAKEAYAIGKKIGKKVILMSTSTGGTLSLQLAANYPEIAGLILYSPNIEINNPSAPLLNDPWGLQIARMVQGSKFNNVTYTHKDFPKYWNPHYRLEATVALESLIEATMNEKLFKKITQPCLTLYYFKDNAHQDKVVKVAATKRMFSQLSTPDYLKVLKAMPNTGNHVIASPLVSKDVEGVEKETAKFIAEKIIKVIP